MLIIKGDGHSQDINYFVIWFLGENARVEEQEMTAHFLISKRDLLEVLLYWNFSKFRSPKCHHTQQLQIRMFWNGTWPFLLTQKSCWSISGSMEQGRGSVLNARPWTLNPRAQKVNMSLCIDFYCDLLVPREILSIWSKIYSSMAMNYKLFFCALSMGIWNWSALHHDL